MPSVTLAFPRRMLTLPDWPWLLLLIVVTIGIWLVGWAFGLITVLALVFWAFTHRGSPPLTSSNLNSNHLGASIEDMAPARPQSRPDEQAVPQLAEDLRRQAAVDGAARTPCKLCKRVRAALLRVAGVAAGK